MSSSSAIHLDDIDTCLHRWSKTHPQKLAIADSQQRLTWQALDSKLNQVANALIQLGLEPNQRLGILGRNSVDYGLLFLGGLRAGLCIVPLSPLASSESLAGMINDSEAKLLFVSQAYADMVEPIADRLTALLPNGLKNLDYDGDGRESFAAFIESASSEDVALPISLDWGFNLIYSSGTTGTPKGILHDRHYRAREQKLIGELGVDEACRTLVSTPLYSNTTLFMFLSTMANGGTAFIMEKFDTQRFLKLSEAEKITHGVLVPVQYERLLNDPEFDCFDLSSYQLKLSTSAPLHKQTKEALLERWPAGGLLEIYGMTEGGVGCFLMAHERPDKLDTVGQPAEGCDLKIISDQGEVLPQGEIGEVIGHSENMMQGYINRDEATKEASWFDKEGRRYHKSGDIGWLDDEGFLHLLDRKKDMIISGGFNVYAIDLERVLLAHADIEDVAVVAAPSQQWGETPVAFVTIKRVAAILTRRILREWANNQLGKAQRISEIRIIDSLPRSPIGKILKRELRDLL